MHQNRLIYTLPEYQNKLRSGYMRLGVFMQRIEDKKVYCFRPIPATPWLPEGRKKYFKRLQRKLKQIDTKHKYTFGTLTYNPAKYTNIEVSKRIKNDLKLFFKRLGYYHRKFQYFYVIELTDNYMPHVHIIFDKYIPHIKMKNSWRAVTGSSIVHIKHIPTQQAFWYCVKYLNDCKKQSTGKWSFIFSHIDRVWSSSRKFFAVAESINKKYKFLFIAFDPRRTFDEFYINPEEDTMSDEINMNDAILIAGFSENNTKIKVFNASADFTFITDSIHYDPAQAGLRVTPETFEQMFNFYKNK